MYSGTIATPESWTPRHTVTWPILPVREAPSGGIRGRVERPGRVGGRLMPLLFADTQVPKEEMDAMFREFVGELEGELRVFQAPHPEASPMGPLDRGRALLEETLAWVRGQDPSTISREDLRRWINLQYDVSLVAVEYLKTYTPMPMVPSRRK